MDEIKSVIVINEGATPSVEVVPLAGEITHVTVGLTLDNIHVLDPEASVARGPAGPPGVAPPGTATKAFAVAMAVALG